MRNSQLAFICFFILCCLAIAIWFFAPDRLAQFAAPAKSPAERCLELVKKSGSLRDPESAQLVSFEDEGHFDIKIRFRAKNGFGGYATAEEEYGCTVIDNHAYPSKDQLDKELKAIGAR